MLSDPAVTTAPPPAPPPLPRRGIQPRWLIAAAVVLLPAAALLFTINPATTRLFPPCPLRSATGLYCPGCGSTRAMHHLLHGRLATAFDFNPLMVVSIPFLAYALARRARRTRPVVPPLPAWAVWALLVVVLAFGVLRNLPWRPVRWMAP